MRRAFASHALDSCSGESPAAAEHSVNRSARDSPRPAAPSSDRRCHRCRAPSRVALRSHLDVLHLLQVLGVERVGEAKDGRQLVDTHAVLTAETARTAGGSSAAGRGGDSGRRCATTCMSSRERPKISDGCNEVLAVLVVGAEARRTGRCRAAAPRPRAAAGRARTKRVLRLAARRTAASRAVPRRARVPRRTDTSRPALRRWRAPARSKSASGWPRPAAASSTSRPARSDTSGTMTLAAVVTTGARGTRAAPAPAFRHPPATDGTARPVLPRRASTSVDRTPEQLVARDRAEAVGGSTSCRPRTACRCRARSRASPRPDASPARCRRPRWRCAGSSSRMRCSWARATRRASGAGGSRRAGRRPTASAAMRSSRVRSALPPPTSTSRACAASSAG